MMAAVEHLGWVGSRGRQSTPGGDGGALALTAAADDHPEHLQGRVGRRERHLVGGAVGVVKALFLCQVACVPVWSYESFKGCEQRDG